MKVFIVYLIIMQVADSSEYLQAADVIPEYLAIINPAAERVQDDKKQKNNFSMSSKEPEAPFYDVLEDSRHPSRDHSGDPDEPDYDELEDPDELPSPSPIATRDLRQRSPNNGESFRI